MKVIFLLALVAAASAFAVDQGVELSFQNWRAEMGKFYSTREEYAYRLGVFASNLQLIAEHNAGNSTFKMGATRFADMTNAEYRQVMLPLTQDFTNYEYDGPVHEMTGGAPTSVDWRAQGAVVPIKDQGQCGSCYAFGGICPMEAAWKMAGHALVAFSDQEIVDCSGKFGNQGCNGGWHDWAMDYVIDRKGIDSMAKYPYTAKKGTCVAKAENIAGSIKSRTRTTQGSEAALVDGVASHVVGIGIDAGKSSFQLYKSGVYYEPSCSSTALNHAVTIVGYEPTYYIVRNSWGLSWGDKGYILMSRDRNNNCGVATHAYYAVA